MSRRPLTLLTAILVVAGTADHSLLADQSTPTAAMRAYYEAARRRDVIAIRKLIPADALKAMQDAKVQVDAALLAAATDVPARMPEVRNERVEGNHATLEINDARTGRWETVAFVKEDGAWKLDLAATDKQRER